MKLRLFRDISLRLFSSFRNKTGFEEEVWFTKAENKQQSSLKNHENEDFSKLKECEKLKILYSEWKKRARLGEVSPRVLTDQFEKSVLQCKSIFQLDQLFKNFAAEELLSVQRDNEIDDSQVNSIVRKFTDSDFNAFNRNRLSTAIRNNEPQIVIDFRFLSQAEFKSAFHLHKELNELIDFNRENSTTPPFHVHFCNYNKLENSEFSDFYSEKLRISENFVNTTNSSYLDLFARERLVYLSSDSRTKMKRFELDKVYIIGGIHDEHQTRNSGGFSQFASINQARLDRIQCESLPIDYHIMWRKSEQNLNVAQVFKVLAFLYSGLSWTESFKKSVRGAEKK